MWIGIAILLLILWAVGALVFEVASFFIHVLVVLAVIALVWHFVSAARRKL